MDKTAIYCCVLEMKMHVCVQQKTPPPTCERLDRTVSVKRCFCIIAFESIIMNTLTNIGIVQLYCMQV